MADYLDFFLFFIFIFFFFATLKYLPTYVTLSRDLVFQDAFSKPGGVVKK